MRFRFFDDLIDEIGPLVCLLSTLAFVAYIAFLAALDRVVKRIEPQNSRFDPGMVWLNLLPVFNLLWMIVTIERVGESIRNEFTARGRHKYQESYGKTTGLAFMILAVVGLLFSLAATPCALVFFFFAFIYWVVYWSQISGYSRRLNRESSSYVPPVDEGW